MKLGELTTHFRRELSEQIAYSRELHWKIRILRILGIKIKVAADGRPTVNLRIWGFTFFDQRITLDTEATPIEIRWVDRFLSENAYESVGRTPPVFENWKEYQSGVAKYFGNPVDFETLTFILRPVNSDASQWVWCVTGAEIDSELFTSDPMSKQQAINESLSWVRRLFFG